jgi:multimeric flavodoxin WrbA
MNLLFLNGSPRQDGNTAKLLQCIMEKTQRQNITSPLFHLGRMRIRGCVGCLVCNQMNGCAVRDEMQILYKEISLADTLVFGFPIYMGQMPAFAKAFTDRLYAFLNPDLTSRFQKPKHIYWIITQGNSDITKWTSYIKSTAQIFELIGFETKGTFFASAINGNISAEIYEQAKEKGLEIAF